MPYTHFTGEQKRHANEIDLPDFLRHQEEKLLSSGPEFRLERGHSVTVQGSRWYDCAQAKGGGPTPTCRASERSAGVLSTASSGRESSPDTGFRCAAAFQCGPLPEAACAPGGGTKRGTSRQKQAEGLREQANFRKEREE